MRITAPWLYLTLALAAGCGGPTAQTAAAPPVTIPDDDGDDDEDEDPPTPPIPVDAGPWRLDMARGSALFVEKCERCHGPNAGGGYGPALTNSVTCRPCESFQQLWPFIDENMPLRNPAACDAQCARDIAAWLMNGLSTAPSCTVEFSYVVAGADRYAALIRIANARGQDVSGWRLGLTLPAGQDFISATGVSAVQTGAGLVLTPDAAHAGIASGGAVEIGIQGTHGGSVSPPTGLRLEASPCFAAPG